MSHTFTQIYIQAVFAVAVRQGLIRPDFKEELQKYITGRVPNSNDSILRLRHEAEQERSFFGHVPA